MTIAGHCFEPPNSPDARCTCGRTWGQIAHVTAEHIGQRDLAHVDTLTAHEASQIIAERERREALTARIWDAVMGVAAA